MNLWPFFRRLGSKTIIIIATEERTLYAASRIRALDAGTRRRALVAAARTRTLSSRGGNT